MKLTKEDIWRIADGVEKLPLDAQAKAFDLLSQHSIELSRKATEFGGHYDGWETMVVKRRTAGS